MHIKNCVFNELYPRDGLLHKKKKKLILNKLAINQIVHLQIHYPISSANKSLFYSFQYC